MFAFRTRLLAASAVAVAGITLFAAGAASAQIDHGPQFAPNYTFADGAKGFSLISRGGPINPGVLVGFNPQPDPPGFGGDDGALIALLNPADPMLFSPATGPVSFRLAIEGLGDGSVIPLPDAPNADGFTETRAILGGHVFDITLRFLGPGPIVPGSWSSFNPQPDPPGDVLAGQLAFVGDPQMFFTISVDGDPLSFALAPPPSGAPEPATWGLMLLGFGGMGAALRSRRRSLAGPA
jgi:hypothetical protein